MIRRVLTLLTFLLAPLSLSAQHALSQGGSYDPAVPTPKSVLGYDVGERFTPHHMILRYVERVAAASRRVHVDTVATTFEGRPLIQIFVTSEANQARRADIQRDAQALANGTTDDAVIRRTPAIVWLGYTVHGGEASGTEASLAVLYQLAAGTDAATRMLLDSTLIIIDPVQNPDGHERHVQDVMRTRSALWVPPSPVAMAHGGNWPGPRTSHYHFDLNRDWYIQSHPESQGRAQLFLTWYPHTAVDLHEMGFNSTYYFAPPMQPVNANVPQNIRDWWDMYAAGNAAAFDARGWPFFRREGYDEFYPGYGDSWPILIGSVGMTYEEASSAGGAIRRADGTVLTLHDAAMHHYTASIATITTSALNRTKRVRDFADFRRNAARPVRSGIRGVAFARDAHGRADSLATMLERNGIEVKSLGARYAARDVRAFGNARGDIAAGSYVVDFAQPNGLLARALLEPDASLDSTFIREELESRETGQDVRFYDITAWSLPYTFNLPAWSFDALPTSLSARAATSSAGAAAARPRVAYAFEPGSEAAIRLLSGLLADSVRVYLAQRAFSMDGKQYPHGAFLVRVAANDEARLEKTRQRAAAMNFPLAVINSSAVASGADLGSNSVIPLRQPRVALVGGPGISGNSFGFTWYAFEQRMGLPVTTISTSALGSNALSEFNVLVIPSAFGLDGAIGEGARSRLADWVRAGGVLITLDGATSWVAGEKLNLTRLRARRDTTRADSLPGAPLPADVPGAIVRVHADTLSVLTTGIDERELPVLVFSDRIYKTPRDVGPGEVVLRYAKQSDLRIAGYMWPEVPARLAGSPYLWTERVGSGRVIAFAGDPNFRDMWRGLLPLFANAVLLGGSF